LAYITRNVYICTCHQLQYSFISLISVVKLPHKTCKQHMLVFDKYIGNSGTGQFKTVQAGPYDKH